MASMFNNYKNNYFSFMVVLIGEFISLIHSFMNLSSEFLTMSDIFQLLYMSLPPSIKLIM